MAQNIVIVFLPGKNEVFSVIDMNIIVSLSSNACLYYL